MPTTDFVDGTVIEADWLNEVDAHVFETILIRAWGRVTNNGATATLVSGSNIASVNRSAVGVVEVTFTSNPSDSNYAVIATSHDGANIGVTVNLINSGNFTVLTWDADSGAAADANFMVMVIR